MRRILASVLAVAVLTVALAAPAAVTRRAITVRAEIAPTATLVEGGQAVDVTVGVACGPGRVDILEAFVYVTQDGNTSQFAGIPVRCSSPNRLRWYVVRVRPLESRFHAGEARASGYVLVIDDRNMTTVSASPGQAIVIR